MEKVVLNATRRDVVGKQVKALRRAGQLPAVIYGRHTEPININLEAHTASLALAKVTSSSLVTINVDGTEYPALVREKQRDYIKNRLLPAGLRGVVRCFRIAPEVAISIRSANSPRQTPTIEREIASPYGLAMTCKTV
jgi:large subunit ribosomal protein L25